MENQGLFSQRFSQRGTSLALSRVPVLKPCRTHPSVGHVPVSCLCGTIPGCSGRVLRRYRVTTVGQLPPVGGTGIIQSTHTKVPSTGVEVETIMPKLRGPASRSR